MPTIPTPADLLIPLVGLSVFNAQQGFASCVTFSLTAAPAAPVEEFYFWIHMCSWRMRSAGKELAHSESDDQTIETAAAMLNGRRLEEIELTKWVTPQGIFHGGMLWFGKISRCSSSNMKEPVDARTTAFSAPATPKAGG